MFGSRATQVSNLLMKKLCSIFITQDSGSVTILWSQPVAALQIQTREGEWRWIRHIENALVGGHVLCFNP
jgi:hypothetical protein